MTPAGLPDYDRVFFCRDHVIKKAPRSVDFIRELPKTGSGEIYKKGIRKQDIGIDFQITARMVVPRKIKGGSALEGLPPFSMRKLKDTQIINDLTSLKTSL